MIDGEVLSRIGVVGIAQADTNDQCIHRMVDEVAAALAAKGVRTHMFDEPKRAEDWAGLKEAGVSSVLCYGISMSQAFLFRKHLRGMNVLFACLDHPIYWADVYQHFARLHEGRAVFSYNTSTNLACALNLIGEHDARLLRHSAAPRLTVPLAEREAAVVFAGNFTPAAEARADLAEVSPALLPLFDEAVVRLETGEAATLEDAVAPGFTDIHGSQRDIFVRLCRQVDRFARSDVRERIVRSLKGVPVHLFGSGWDSLDLPSNVRRYGSRDVSEVHAANGQAQLVINSTPRYYESHERMFEAAAAAAGLITARNPYTQATFGQCAELFDTPEEVGDLCARLLADRDRLEEFSARGHALIHDREGWPHRVEEIIRMLDPAGASAQDGEPDAETQPHTAPVSGQRSELRAMARQSRIDCDLALDLRDLATLDLSLPRLATATTIRITVAPDNLDRVVELLAQVRDFLAEGVRVVVVLEMLVPPGGFIGLGNALDRLGFPTAEVSLGMGQSTLTVVKTAELAESDLTCILSTFCRSVSLAFPATRDPQRLAAVHFKTIDRPEMLAALDRVADRPGVFLDLGAGAGSHAIYVAGVLGREVVAVESDPAQLACLRANVATNQLGHLIRILEVAEALNEPVALVKWAGGTIPPALLDTQAPPVIVAADEAVAVARLALHGYARDSAETAVPLYRCRRG